MSKPSDMPYQVLTDTGGIHSGYETSQKADAACFEANQRAEKMGIVTRYIVKGMGS